MTAYTPNLPALITALPSDHTRAPQTEFDRARQVLFLENLSVTGSVRSAASAAQVSHQTAYRARRATPAFRTAWDAALLVARQAAADTLACRAIDGIEEKVFYHGEEIATRTRYSDRLLLAHLARLDRLIDDPAANAFAQDWDASVQRHERGEAQPVPAAVAASAPADTSAQSLSAHPCEPANNFSSGPCNTRSMSYTSWEEARDAEDEVDWEDEDEAEDHLDRVQRTIDEQRPHDAPLLTGSPNVDPDGLNADAQWTAFLSGVRRWWLVIGPAPMGEPGTAGYRWFYHGQEADAARAKAARWEQGTEAGSEH